jgi:hypothetical protein
MTTVRLPGRTSVQSVPRSMRRARGLGAACTLAHHGASCIPQPVCTSATYPGISVVALPCSVANPAAPGSASGILQYACAPVLLPPGCFACAQAASTPQLFNPPSYTGPNGACCCPSLCPPVCAPLPVQAGCWSTFSDWNKILILGGAALVLYLLIRK